MTLRNLADFIDSSVRVPAAGVYAYLHPQARDTINFWRFLLGLSLVASRLYVHVNDRAM